MTAAYETLRDPRRRAAYDQAHPAVRPVAYSQSGPRAVQRATPSLADIEVTLGFSAAHARRSAPLQAGPVEVVPPARPQPASPFGAEDEFAQFAAYVSRWLRTAW